MIFSPILVRLVDGDKKITPQIIFIVAIIFAAGFISGKINNWQEKYLDGKPRSFSFVFLGVLLVLMALPTLSFLIFK